MKGGVQMKSVCIVIVTWNRLEMLKACVAAARKNAAAADILVVDNVSTDGTGEWLAQQTGVNVLSLPENTGGAGGFAAGMKWAFDRGAITLVVEWNFKGTTLVLKGVMDGMHGRWGKLR